MELIKGVVACVAAEAEPNGRKYVARLSPAGSSIGGIRGTAVEIDIGQPELWYGKNGELSVAVIALFDEACRRFDDASDERPLPPCVFAIERDGRVSAINPVPPRHAQAQTNDLTREDALRCLLPEIELHAVLEQSVTEARDAEDAASGAADRAAYADAERHRQAAAAARRRLASAFAALAWLYGSTLR